MSKFALDPNYVKNKLIPNLNATILQTEHSGNASTITKFSPPAPGNSTYSFGLYQYDVKGNSDARNFLTSIGFNSTQIGQLSKNGGLPKTTVDSLSAQLGTALQNPANQAALQQLNATWANGLVTQLQNAINVIGQSRPDIASQIVQSPELQLRMLDYANQFGGITLTGPKAYMVNWLSGQSVREAGGTFQVAPGQKLTGDDISQFVINSRQGVNSFTSQDNRLNRLDSAIASLGLENGGVSVKTSTSADGNTTITSNYDATGSLTYTETSVYDPATGATTKTWSNSSGFTGQRKTGADGSVYTSGYDALGNLINDRWSNSSSGTCGTDIFSLPNGNRISQFMNSSGTDIVTATNASGYLQYRETTSTSSIGQVSVAISGTGDVVDISNASVTIADGASATVGGDNNNFTCGSSATVNLTGAGDTTTLKGSGDVVNVNYGTITLGANVVATVNGSADNIIGGSNARVTLNDGFMSKTTNYDALGNMASDNWTYGAAMYGNDAFNAANGSSTSNWHNADGTSGSQSMGANGSSTYTTYYANSVISFQSAYTVNADNSTSTTNFAQDSFGNLQHKEVLIRSSTGKVSDSFTGNCSASASYDNNATINLANSSQVIIYGDHNILTSGTGATCEIDGRGNQLNLGAATTVTLGGSGDVVTGSSAKINVNGYVSANINGSNNTLTCSAYDSVSLTGSGNIVNVGATGATISLQSGTGNTVNATGGSDTINLNANVGATINGSSDIINLTGGGAIAIASGDTINVSSGISAYVIGVNDTLMCSAGDAITTTGADTIQTAAGTLSVVGNNVITTSADGQTTQDAQFNSSNTKTELLTDYSAGNSQVQLFSGLASGISSETQNYSAANGTGTETSQITDFTAGGSAKTLFTVPGDKSATTYFSGADATGTRTEGLVNFANGSSQVQFFSNLASGISYEARNYSGANGTGYETSQITDFTAGGSQLASYTGFIGGGAPYTTTYYSYYSGADATGTHTESLTNFADGTSQVQWFSGLASGISFVQQNYSASNGMGAETSQITNFTKGGSQVQLFTPASGISLQATDYSAAYGTGTETSQLVNFATGGSQETVYKGLAAGMTGVASVTSVYTGANATGTHTENITQNIISSNSGLQSQQVAQYFHDPVSSAPYYVASSIATNSSDLSLGTGNTLIETITATNQTITLAPYASATIYGGGNTIFASYDTITLGIGTSATIEGGNNIINASGDQIILVPDANSVTVVNGKGDAIKATGDMITLGSGSSASIDGSGNMINASGDTFTLGANATDNISGSRNSITLGTGDIVTATSDTFTLGANSTDSVLGNGNSIMLNTGDTITTSNTGITLASNSSATINGTGNTINASGDRVTLGSNATESVRGNGNSVTLGAYDTVTLTGTNGNAPAGDNVTLVANAYDSVLGTGNSISLSTGDTIITSYNGITLASNSSATITGNGNTINASGDAITLGSNSVATINGTGNTVTLTDVKGDFGMIACSITLGANATDTVVDSGANTITLGTGDTVSIVNKNTFDNIYMSANATDTLIGSGNYISLAAGDTLYTSGNTEYVQDDNAIANVIGNGNRINAMGNSDTINASGAQITVWPQYGAVPASVKINGTGNNINAYNTVITLGSSSSATINGDKNTITDSNDTITLNGTDNTITASNDTITLRAGSSAKIVGSGNIVNGKAVTSGTKVTVSIPAPPPTPIYPSFPVATGGGIYLGAKNIVGLGNITGGGGGGTINLIPIPTGSGGPINIDYNPGVNVQAMVYSNGYIYTGGSLVIGGYGFAGKESTVASALGNNIGTIAQYDLNHGDMAGAAAAGAAWHQAAQAAAQSTKSSVLDGVKWDNKMITWSLADSSGTVSAPFSGYMGKSYEEDVQHAFAVWAAASGLTFKEVSDSVQSDIRLGFGNFDTANSGVIGYTSMQAQAGLMAPNAIIRIEDPTQNALTTGPDGQKIYSGTDATVSQILLHEIGHALGLASNADAKSVMNYQLTSNNRTLDATDISGIQSIYGPNQGISPTSSSSINQLIQAMASFAPVGAGQTIPLAANEPPLRTPLLATAH